jgi:hypothetical protein
VKPVREATIEAVKLLKEIGPPIEESEYNESKSQKSGAYVREARVP